MAKKKVDKKRSGKMLRIILIVVIIFFIVSQTKASNGGTQNAGLNPFKPNGGGNSSGGNSNPSGGGSNYSGGSSYVSESFPIGKGMKGAKVRAIQSHLNTKGSGLKVDGLFGSKTQSALTNNYGVSTVSQTLYNQIVSAGGGTPTTPVTNGNVFPLTHKQYFQTGVLQEVKNLQSALNRKHNAGLSIDGKFGDKTMRILDKHYSSQTVGGSQVTKSLYQQIIA